MANNLIDLTQHTISIIGQWRRDVDKAIADGDAKMAGVYAKRVAHYTKELIAATKIALTYLEKQGQ